MTIHERRATAPRAIESRVSAASRERARQTRGNTRRARDDGSSVPSEAASLVSCGATLCVVVVCHTVSCCEASLVSPRRRVARAAPRSSAASLTRTARPPCRRGARARAHTPLATAPIAASLPHSPPRRRAAAAAAALLLARWLSHSRTLPTCTHPHPPLQYLVARSLHMTPYDTT